MGETARAEPVVLPDVTGQQVCDLLSDATLAKYVPESRSSNATVSSTETLKSGRCDSKDLNSAALRFLSVEVRTAIPAEPDGTPIPGGTPEATMTEWVADQRAGADTSHEQGETNGITHEPPADLAVGDEGFTQFSLSTDGTTDADGSFRSGPWGVYINYHGSDRPDPDDRDNKQYLAKDVLIAAIAELGTEIEGNLAGLSGGGEPSGAPGEVTGDVLCAALPDEVIERYLPGPEDRADTSPEREGATGAGCQWDSAEPRTDSPGLRHRSASVTLTVAEYDLKEDFDERRRNAQEWHEASPIQDEDEGKAPTTYLAPQDVPGLGLAAWLQVQHLESPDNPGSSATMYVLLSGNRTVVITYAGHDGAELDIGSPDDGDLGKPARVPDEELTGAVEAMTPEILAVLG